MVSHASSATPVVAVPPSFATQRLADYVSNTSFNLLPFIFMNLAGLIDALREAVNPKWKRNRRRLTSVRVQRCVNVIARTCAMIHAVPVVCRKVYRRIFPPRPIQFRLACGCDDPNHPRHRYREREHPWPRFKHAPKGRMKDKFRQ